MPFTPSPWLPTKEFPLDGGRPSLHIRASVNVTDALAAGVDLNLLQRAIAKIEQLGPETTSDLETAERMLPAVQEAFLTFQPELDKVAMMLVVYPRLVPTARDVPPGDPDVLALEWLTLTDKLALFGEAMNPEVAARLHSFRDQPGGEAAALPAGSGGAAVPPAAQPAGRAARRRAGGSPDGA